MTWRASGTSPPVRRVLEIAVLDTLGLDDSVARSRVLVGAVAAAKLIEAEREASFGCYGSVPWSDRLRIHGYPTRSGTALVI
jgi:hypothetical protein